MVRRVRTVTAQCLALLPNLHILLLAGNQLTSLHPRALAGLEVLSSLSLNQNRLRDLPPGLLANASYLQAGGPTASTSYTEVCLLAHVLHFGLNVNRKLPHWSFVVPMWLLKNG